jgi:hypothetical protein
MVIVLSSEETPEEPVVRVRSVRRRRHEPPKPVVPPPPNVRNWLIYVGLIILIAVLMIDGFLAHRPQHPTLPSYSETTEVRSSLAEVSDSLQIVVSWDLTLADSAGRPDSIRVKVLTDRARDTLLSTQPSNQLSDTLYLKAPGSGESLRGISCAAAEHPGKPLEENCTPWQYVRPSVAAGPEQAAGPPNEIVLKPGGLQVDPDIGGKCAAWQQRHPNASVWIQVNRKAIPECTGPNRKPTVAQFCAFVVLPDGRRVKTANSINNRYCDELFEEWTRERYS